ncbi:MAG: Regulatory protein RecX [Candidatus Woesebacteria bacterium GW2011_GWB1_39_12]|uniref:Regulatory protein RecX n=2 Tax=Candidatus Woeseibacteriota TaxID=1752722 RepID=A0A0G0MDH0_9BACT|nr:MAG: Regulatory protein RecX [Candidatus Woesebacteria bacterium GW2011_GWA1_39_12]KKR01444.1 MAG: Regulatory protein RecX [Candidatus Woesebacteria bacterium GW2011_GWB1_39_12]
MPTVTSIKPQKNQKRVNIYLDDKFGFGLDLENFVKLGLKVGQELTEKQIEEIVKKAEFQKVYDKILRFGSLRPRSEKEYLTWLRKYKVHESLYKELFNRLKRLEFLDDKKFTVWWIGQRLQFKSKSKKELVQELRIKGIDKEIIDAVLAESKIDEVAMAKKLLKKRKYMWEKLSDFESRKKMSEFLLRKGFNWEVIREVIKGIDADSFDV